MVELFLVFIFLAVFTLTPTTAHPYPIHPVHRSQPGRPNSGHHGSLDGFYSLQTSATPIPLQSPLPTRFVHNSHPLASKESSSTAPDGSQYQFPSPLPSPRTCPVIFPNGESSNDDEQPSARILGGVPASRTSASYMAAIHEDPYYVEGDEPRPEFEEFACSAVVLSSRWLLTAAHCHPMVNSTVTFGAPSANKLGGVRIAAAFFPDEPDDTRVGVYDRDVCIVRLQSDAPKDVSFALVNGDQKKPYGSSYARAVGYGMKQDPSAPDAPLIPDNTLRQVDIPVAEQAECVEVYQDELVQINITDDMVCAGSAACGPCFGDSGGPLLQFDKNGLPVVMGVVSGGIRCGDGKWPAMFARTSRYLDWMTENGAEFNISGDAEQILADGTPVQLVESPNFSPSALPEASPPPDASSPSALPEASPPPDASSPSASPKASDSSSGFPIPFSVLLAVAAIALTAVILFGLIKLANGTATNKEVAVEIGRT